METNRHHILHYNEYWNANKDNKALRRSLGLIALIDLDSHRALHRECPAPPPLDIFTAQRALKLYVPDPDPLRGIDNFRFAVEEAIKSPKSHEIERQTARLAIDAVTLQIPYIREGIMTAEAA